jgi:hypothetical protein
MNASPSPFSLSLSKACPSFARAEEEMQGFDKLSLSGFGAQGRS